MFIPRNNLPQKTDNNSENQAEVKLKASHLILKHDLVQQAFGEEQNVYVAYDVERNTLRVAPVSNQFFPKLYTDAAQYLLKERNLIGDKSIALHDILIDHDIDMSNRALTYSIQPGKDILNVHL